MCNSGLMSLDAGSAVKNGIIQLISGVISLAFGVTSMIYYELYVYWKPSRHGWPGWAPGSIIDLGSGIWTGVFIITGGILMLLAGKTRSFCCTIAALVVAIVNIWFSLVHFSIVMVAIYNGLASWHCWSEWVDDIDPDVPMCADRYYGIMMFVASILILAAIVQMFAVFWAIVVTSKAIHGRKKETTTTTTLSGNNNNPDSTSTGADPCTGVDASASEIHRNVHARNVQLKWNWRFQLVLTILSVVLTIVILFVVAYGVQSGNHDGRALYFQKTAGSLWCAPVYVLCVYLGFRATTYGENASLISFLVVNCLQVLLCLCECATSAFAIYDMDAMGVVNLVQFDIWDKGYEVAPDGWRFQNPLITLHSTIIVAAVLHFCLSIWGIVAASSAVHRDGACDCGTCDCGVCDCGTGTAESAVVGACCADVRSVPYVVQVVTPMTMAGENANATRYILVPVNDLGPTASATVASPSVTAPVYDYVDTNALISESHG